MVVIIWRLSNSHRIWQFSRRCVSTIGKIEGENRSIDSEKQIDGLVRVRFAPSPTGFVHIGGLRAIAYNYFFARSHPGGRFILRIEDTDRDRIVEGAAEQLESTLAWMGMEADESPLKGGSYGPYVQSQRLHIYREAVDRLVDEGKAYRCFCSNDRLALLKKEALKNREAVRYDNRCSSLTKEEIDKKLEQKTPYAVRFRLRDEPNSFTDTVFGRYEYNVSTHEGDPVVMKTDGYPTYHLANVVDDHFMRITHVIRGEEWLQSTPKHLQLYAAFDWSSPIYAHLPVITGKKGMKLSKRDAAANLDTYLQNGYYPLALINSVFSSGGGFDTKKDKHRLYTVDELISMFDLEKTTTRSTRLEMEFLDKYNKQYMKILWSEKKLIGDLRRLVAAKLEKSIKSERDQENLIDESLDDTYLERILNQYMIDDRATTLVQLLDNADNAFLWRYDQSLHPDLRDSTSKSIAKGKSTQDMVSILENLLIDFENRFSDKSIDYTIDTIKAFLSDFEHRSGVSHRLTLPFIRLLITHNLKGLPIAEMFYLLGKERSIRRLKHGIGLLKKSIIDNEGVKEKCSIN